MKAIAKGKRMFISAPSVRILIALSVALAFSAGSSEAAVNPLTGNYHLDQVDLMLSCQALRLDISRSFDSIYLDAARDSGGWLFHPFDKEILPPGDTDTLILRDGTDLVFFEKTGKSGFFTSPDNEKITCSNGLFTRHLKDGGLEVYDQEGRLSRMVDRNGLILTFLYRNGKLERVFLKGMELLRYFRNPEGLIERIRAYNGASSSYKYNHEGMLVEAINQDNISTTFRYDAQGRLEEVKFQTGDFVRIKYSDDTGTVESIANRYGVTSYAYERDEDGAPSRVTITYPSGVERIAIEEDGRVVKKTGEAGGVTKKEYDDDGNLIRYTDANGHAADYEYDSRSRLHRIIQPDGGKFSFSHLGETSLPGRCVFPDGSEVNYAYNDRKQLVKISGPAIPEVFFTYNDLGLVAEKSRGKGPGKFFVKYGYLGSRESPAVAGGGATVPLIAESRTGLGDEAGYLMEETDSLGRKTRYERDERGRLIKTVDPLGREWKYSYNYYGILTGISVSNHSIYSVRYDENLRPIEIRDEHGFPICLSYDDEGNVKSVAYPTGAKEIYEYDGQGRLKSILDSKSGSWSAKYNSSGLITEETDPGGATAEYRYDPLGNPVEIEDASGYATRLRYDSMNRIESVTDPEGNTHYYAYDEMSRLTSEKDAMGNVKKYSYDAAGNLSGVALPNGEGVVYEFDPEGPGNLVSARTSDGREYSYEYDPAGRRIREKTPWGESVSYSYDAADNLIEESSSSGNTVSYRYDELDRLAGLEASGGIEETYERGPEGYVTRITGADYEKNMSYDEFGNVISEEYSLLGVSVRRTYDRWGNVTSLEVPDHLKILYKYDDSGRLISIEYDDGKEILVSYDDSNRRSGISYPNGVSVKYGYNKLDLLERLAYLDAGGKVLGDYRYKYDRDGRLVKITDVEGCVREFAYDPNGQLLRASSPNGGKNSFVYGAGFRRLAQTTAAGTAIIETARLLGSPIDEAFPWASMEEALKAAAVDLLTSGSGGFAYNEAGQMIRAGSVKINYGPSGGISRKFVNGNETEYDFDSLGRLSRIRSPARDVRYAYAPEGPRISKQIGGRKTHYIYDGLNLLMELDREKNPLKIFIHARAIDSPLVMLKDGESYFYLPDHLGSTAALADDSGGIVTRYEYEPFGRTEREGRDAGNPLTYTGRYFDRESGLYYYRSRYYDPELGIFISPDPEAKDLFEPKDFSPYLYAFNDPVNYIDPLGTEGASGVWSGIQSGVSAFGRGAVSLGRSGVSAIGRGASAIGHRASAFFKGSQGWGGGIFSAGMTAYNSWRTATKYGQNAAAENRELTWGERILCTLECVVRSVIDVATLGVTETLANLVQYAQELFGWGGALEKWRKSSEDYEEFLKKVSGILKKLVKQASTLLAEAEAIQKEQDAAIEEARSLERKIRELEDKINAKREALNLGDAKAACENCKGKIKALNELSSEMDRYDNLLSENQTIAKDNANRVCSNPNTGNAESLVTAAEKAAEAVHEITGKMLQLGEQAKKLKPQIESCISKVREHNAVVDRIPGILSELAEIKSAASSHAKDSWEAALDAKRCAPRCNQLVGRLNTIFNIVNSIPGSHIESVEIAGYLTKVKDICSNVSTQADKGETYANNADSGVKSIEKNISKFEQQLNSAETCDIDSVSANYFAELDAASANGLYVEAQGYARKARNCLDAALATMELDAEVLLKKAKKIKAEQDAAVAKLKALNAELQGLLSTLLEVKSSVGSRIRNLENLCEVSKKNLSELLKIPGEVDRLFRTVKGNAETARKQALLVCNNPSSNSARKWFNTVKIMANAVEMASKQIRSRAQKAARMLKEIYKSLSKIQKINAELGNDYAQFLKVESNFKKLLPSMEKRAANYVNTIKSKASQCAALKNKLRKIHDEAIKRQILNICNQVSKTAEKYSYIGDEASTRIRSIYSQIQAVKVKYQSAKPCNIGQIPEWTFVTNLQRVANSADKYNQQAKKFVAQAANCLNQKKQKLQKTIKKKQGY